MLPQSEAPPDAERITNKQIPVLLNEGVRQQAENSISPDKPMRSILRITVLLLLCSTRVVASSFYVAPHATESGTGSFETPWQLQAALNQPPALHPGDTVWVMGGTYSNTFTFDPSYGNISFVCNTNGTSDSPIIFRNYNNERATLDGETNQIVLYLGTSNNFTSGCSYTWFWGLEVMSSAPVRAAWRSYIQCLAPHMKFINMILHDMADGIDLWNAAKGAELYGCLIFHNGWDEGTLAHGHGIYTQNDTTNTRIIHNNILFSGYGFNVKLWSTNQGIDNYDIRNNIVFNGGACTRFTDSRLHNFYIVNNNPDRPTRNLVMKHNYTYAGITASVKGLCNNIGANYGSVNMTLDSNYFLGQLRLTPPFENFSARGNRIYGGTALPFLRELGTIDWSQWIDTDTSQDVPAEGFEYFLLPNKYEPNLAYLAVYNWAEADEIRIDGSALNFAPGEQYQLINVTDYYNDIITRTYPFGNEIVVPMTGHTTAGPIGGEGSPVSQFPKFGVFVIRKAQENPASVRMRAVDVPLYEIYPNPSATHVAVHLSISRAGTYQVSITDILGKLLHVRQEAFLRTGNALLEFDTRDLARGTYFFRVVGKTESFHGKFLISR